MKPDELASIESLRRLFIKMNRLLELRPNDSALIDLVNHADAIAQQLQNNPR